MKKNAYSDSEHTRDDGEITLATAPVTAALPNRLLTAFDVAEFVGLRDDCGAGRRNHRCTMSELRDRAVQESLREERIGRLHETIGALSVQSC